MAEYIERGAVRKLTLAAALAYGREPNQYVSFLDELENIPAADVAEVRHGRWEKFVTASGIISRVRCSVCTGTQSPKFESMPYCPTCGARMDKEADHEVSE